MPKPGCKSKPRELLDDENRRMYVMQQQGEKLAYIAATFGVCYSTARYRIATYRRHHASQG